jgi:putative endonuclease
LPNYVYILTNVSGTVLYTGVTRELRTRVWQHKEKLIESFTRRYNVTRLVYYEVAESVMAAAEREKVIKGGSRSRKIALIESMNPEWRDLYDEL